MTTKRLTPLELHRLAYIERLRHTCVCGHGEESHFPKGMCRWCGCSKFEPRSP